MDKEERMLLSIRNYFHLKSGISGMDIVLKDGRRVEKTIYVKQKLKSGLFGLSEDASG